MAEKLTVRDLQDSLDGARIPNGGILLRANSGSTGFLELHDHQVLDAFAEILRKMPRVSIKLDEFTACEKLVYLIIKAHAEQGYPPTPYSQTLPKTKVAI